MRKSIYFLPVVIFALIYGFIGITMSFNAISPIVIAWMILFAIASCLLIKKVFWGAILGVLPAIHLIYMSMQETRQAIEVELLLGIIILCFYSICGYLVYKSKRA